MKRFFLLLSIQFVMIGIILCGTVAASNSGSGKKSLSGDIKTTVVSILSKYDSGNLTAADANAINNAFREAGVHRGTAQQEAIQAAGFDPKKISSLDPPPDQEENDSSAKKIRQGQ